MSTLSPTLPTSLSPSRWYYVLSSFSLLAITFVGFHLFYLRGEAYPGRPLTPPIRSLVILHGSLMTVWMLLAVIQPLLVSIKRPRLHVKFGTFGVVLAVVIVVTGVLVGIESARVTPPDLRFFGLTPKEFMAVPVLSILVFAGFVTIGVLNRHRPKIHRPMMLMASVSVVGAALGRISVLNALYADTWLEVVFSGFFMQVVLAVFFLVVNGIVLKSFDRWLATAVAMLTAATIAISLGARTQAWDRFATFLLGS